ncbi:MAG: hypothetical protein QOF89_1411 [Acidobacteriota bacterium]|jgi:hypothetical protein|nr:hypothetical protein [Acidobacteriota bacterium]
MRKTIIPGLALVLFLAASALLAQAPQKPQKPAPSPGFVPLAELNLFPQDKLSAEVNLEGAILRLVAAAVKQEDPAFSSMVASLRSINVQVFPLAGIDAGAVKTKIDRAVHWLEDRGWKANLRVKEKGEETYIYLKEQDGQIVGLTVLTFQPGDEAAVINISGRIDPAQIGRLGQSLHVQQLERVPAGKKPH